jgi:hypothetical protein
VLGGGLGACLWISICSRKKGPRAATKERERLSSQEELLRGGVRTWEKASIANCSRPGAVDPTASTPRVMPPTRSEKVWKMGGGEVVHERGVSSSALFDHGRKIDRTINGCRPLHLGGLKTMHVAAFE